MFLLNLLDWAQPGRLLNWLAHYTSRAPDTRLIPLSGTAFVGFLQMKFGGTAQQSIQ